MFPLIKIRLTFEALQDINFPYYAGSSLRGAFGKSLRRVSCLTPKTKCIECAMAVNCPYASVFENGYMAQGKAGEDVPNPYVIEPMPLGQKQVKAGECFAFEQIIFGNSVNKLSYILLSWVKTGNLGFTKERTPAKLLRIEEVEPDGTILLLHDLEHPSQETDTATPCYEPELPQACQRVKIALETPLRIHHAGHPVVPDKLTAYDFLMSVIRRQANMAKYHIAEYAPIDVKNLSRLAKDVRLENADLRWLDWKRYSSRQKQEIALGGIIGTFELSGDLADLYPYIKAGEYFHGGKGAVMGMGKYRVIEHRK
ncbi:MAG: CRISPR system precrRNA processing endoribonuclease RAMP protein Cas6 [Alphaproteobacteria bacterium]